jgi:hypothetical protein
MNERLYYIDRLRFIAVIILIFYHSGLVFAYLSNYPIKNNELSVAMEHITFFFHNWRLSLLFFISGIGTAVLIKKRGTAAFAGERTKRLLVPLVFGILIVVPPQIYFERLAQGFEYDSYLDFYLQSFSTGFYPYGNISWAHLWFVAYLLIYSLLSIPLFRLIRKSPQTGLSRVHPLLWALPMIVVYALLKPYSTGVQNIFNDLAMFSFYWMVFIAGFIVCDKDYFEKIGKHLVLYAALAIVLMILNYVLKWKSGGSRETGLFLYISSIVKISTSWVWVLLLIAAGKKWLDRKPGKWLSILNESVYPVYILHQTAIICIAYFVVGESWSIAVKFTIITSGTLISSFGIYLLARQFRITRSLFGLKAPR